VGAGVAVGSIVLINAVLYVNYDDLRLLDFIWPPRVSWFFALALGAVVGEVVVRRH
jgi:hypothetical protein